MFGASSRGIWKQLDTAVRELGVDDKIYETYVVINGTIFDFDMPVVSIGASDSIDVTLPGPHSFFKSVLTEDRQGDLHMWSFILPNEESNKQRESFLVQPHRGRAVFQLFSMGSDDRPENRAGEKACPEDVAGLAGGLAIHKIYG